MNEELNENKIVTNDNEKENARKVNPASTLESNRLNFYNSFKKAQMINLIVMVAFIALMGISLWLLISYGDYLPYILIGIVVVFAGTFIYSRKMKKMRTNKVREHVSNYRKEVNDYIYDEVTDDSLQQDPFGKLNEDNIKALNIFNNVNSVDSNDVVNGKISNHSFISGNVVIYKENEADKKKPEIGFYGRIFQVEFEDEFDGLTVIYLPNENGNGPDIIKGMDEAINVIDEPFHVYSTAPNVKELISQSAKYIKKINTSEYLSDFLMIFKGNKVSFLFSYSDLLVDIPMKDAIIPEMYEVLKEHVKIVSQIVERIK